MVGFGRLLLLCFCCILWQDALGAPGKQRTYAVVIGISQYQNPALSTLRFSDRDATLFAAYLQSKAGGNVPAGNIRLLLNENAGIAAIYDALNWLQEHCGKDDKAYIYFSGHGDVETENKFSLGYLLAYNSPPNNYRNNAIALEDLNKVANQLSTENNVTVVLVTDACHTGKLAGDYYKGKQLVARQLQQILNNETRLAACEVNEEAAESEDWGGGRGVFSYYLLQGLNGLADLDQNDTIQLKELNRYLDSAFITDKILVRNAHKQHPVSDGNPYQTIAMRDISTLNSLTANVARKPGGPQSAVQIFGSLAIQPIDYLFTLIKNQNIASKLHFSTYGHISPDSLPLQIVEECILYQQQLDKEKATNPERDKTYFFARTDSLQMLKTQFSRSRNLTRNFNERFVQLVHSQAQEMVNAYLSGDIDELEKRQYYSDDKFYSNFLSMLRVALQVCPQDNFLYQLLNVQEAYLSGLSLRLQMATAPKPAPLLDQAFSYQEQALKLEPYAAYIHNELGNLYILRKKYALADRHFDIARELSPTWAVPWSNKIRIGLATRNLRKAIEALQISDSLQPDLSYSFVNAGLAMEQHGNLLAAESYFLKAIRENERHFLPYERLGSIYTSTGDYGKADWYLTEAAYRKRGYSLNMDYFITGLASTGAPPRYPGDWLSCDMFRDVAAPASKPYVQLVDALKTMQENPEKTLQSLKRLSAQHPKMPLVQHYRGKMLFERKKWAEAEPILLDSINTYQPDTSLADFLQKSIGMRSEADTCLLVQMIGYQYNRLEDHYLLAAINEHLKQPEKALQRYQQISDIENNLLKDQATFQGDFAKTDNPWYAEFLQYSPYAQNPELAPFLPLPEMAGYLKIAKNQEDAGDYLSAEKTYLRQVQLNLEVGNARVAALQKMNFAVSNARSYRIQVNRLAEAATFQFYERMDKLFPRDSEWQRKAGIFLYNRLARAFSNVPAASYELAYKILKSYSYPFLANESFGTVPGPGEIQVAIPGTGEFLQVAFPVYDPALVSLEKLKMAVRLSGDLEPDPHLLEAIADLLSWTGKRKEALEKYRELIARHHPDAALLTKIINYSIAAQEPDLAVQQLEVLYNRGETTRAQNMQLADWYALSGQPGRATIILEKEKTKNPTLQNEASLILAKTNLLAGRKSDALTYLQAAPASLHADAENRNPAKAVQDYSLARLYARQRQKNKAFAALYESLKNGFTSENVVATDPAWERLRKSARWKEMMKQYPFQPREKFYKQDHDRDWYGTLDQLLSE
ncbi:TPR end-of-group domain-containing protein [Dyadobacter luticola]|uniref:Uncharacterized protein n=1 Tax=Dyadobacter luticola TaxID=1979387 RepID=A0A5R9L659_9BACT|nr:caspase family protein [Dyadobacter luticola]TLV03891.1 hypothetical protein FEN17_09965 [Dyadobacter luticola]